MKDLSSEYPPIVNYGTVKKMIAVALPRQELGTRATARTKEIERCLTMNPEFIWMIDLDHLIEPAILQMMLDSASFSDVVVVDAPSRGAKDSNIYYHPNGSLDHFTISCCLLRADIFKQLEKPWFRSDIAYVRRQPVDGFYSYEIVEKSTDDNVGEDVYFSKKCLEKNLRINILEGVQSYHASHQ